MDTTRLNPFVREMAIYRRPGRSEECIAYDSRLFYVLSGDINAVVGGEKLGHIGPCELLYIPAGVPYRLKSQYLNCVVVSFDLTSDMPAPAERISPVSPAEFKAELCHRTADSAPFDKPILLKELTDEGDELCRMCEIFTSEEGSYRARVSAMLKLLLLRIMEAADENALPSRLVESLDAYIRENAREEISNTELGAIFGYHPFYISQLMKEKKGITLHQYVILYRLKTAKSLLRYTALSVSEIAEQAGFTDASYFTKTFKASTGMTPKEYRNQFKEDFL